jgi:hypothetical protein
LCETRGWNSVSAQCRCDRFDLLTTGNPVASFLRLPVHRVPRQDCRSYNARPPQSLSAYSGPTGGATCVKLALVPVGTIDISPVIYGRVRGSPHPFASRQGRLNEGRANFKRPSRDAEKGVRTFTRCSKHRATIKRPAGRSYVACASIVSSVNPTRQRFHIRPMFMMK